MARRSGTSRTRLILGIIITVVVLYLALSGGTIPSDVADLIEEQLGIDVPAEIVDEPGGDDVVRTETTFNTNLYSLYFTEPINESDWSLHEGSAVEAAIIEAINGAQTSIDAALFELNMESIAQAFIDAHNRGVQVRMVFDDDHAVFDEESMVEQIEAAGIPFRDDERAALMHHKFLVIDGVRVWTGSMNFTHNGIYNNNNNVIQIRSTQLAENYTTEFEEMFEDGVFTDQADTRQTPHPRIEFDGTLVENYFSPEEGEAIAARIEELVNEAQTSVHIMAFSMTLDELGEAAINAHNRGLTVQGVFENRQSSEFEEKGKLVCAGVPIKLDGNPNTFHHKVFVIDGRIVVFGSFNFSASARDNNSENVLIIHDETFAQQFLDEFDRRFNDPNANTPSRSQFGC